jgi:GNAT superfamily N-acetyltransferase
VSKPSPPDGYAIEPLDSALHDRETFSCGNEELDAYLKTQANQQQSRFLAGTHVLLEANSPSPDKRPIIGFLTLVTRSIPLVDCPEKFRKITSEHGLTVMLLARMAVHSAHKGKGLGAFLIHYTFASAVLQAEISGCPAIIVDPKEGVGLFYSKYGFSFFPDNSKRMFITTSTAKAMLRVAAPGGHG